MLRTVRGASSPGVGLYAGLLVKASHPELFAGVELVEFLEHAGGIPLGPSLLNEGFESRVGDLS